MNGSAGSDNAGLTGLGLEEYTRTGHCGFYIPKTRSFIIVRLISFITKTHQFVTVAGDLAN